MEIFKIEQTDTPLGPQCVVVWPPFYWPLLLFIPFFMFFAWRGVRAVHSLIFVRFVPEGALIVLGFCGVWLFMVSVLVVALFGKTRLKWHYVDMDLLFLQKRKADRLGRHSPF